MGYGGRPRIGNMLFLARARLVRRLAGTPSTRVRRKQAVPGWEGAPTAFLGRPQHKVGRSGEKRLKYWPTNAGVMPVCSSHYYPPSFATATSTTPQGRAARKVMLAERGERQRLAARVLWCSLLPAGSTDKRSEARAAQEDGPGAPSPPGLAHSGPPGCPGAQGQKGLGCSAA